MRILISAVLVLASSVAYAGTPVAPGVQNVAVPNGQCLTPQTILRYEYQDTEEVIQVPRTTETHIVPRIIRRYEYVDVATTVQDPPIVVDPCDPPVVVPPVVVPPAAVNYTTEMVVPQRHTRGVGLIGTYRLNRAERIRAKLLSRRSVASPTISCARGI